MSAVSPSRSNTAQSSLKCVYLSPLMVAPLGCRPIREAPLRTRGTRGLPEYGVPHCSSLIHQVWRSHCSAHTKNTHTHHNCHLKSIRLLRLSRTITFALRWFKHSWKQFTWAELCWSIVICWEHFRAQCVCVLIPVRTKMKHINKRIYAIWNWCTIWKHEAITFDYIITERKINWARAFLSSGYDQSVVCPLAVKRLLRCNAVKRGVTQGGKEWEGL